MTGHDKVTAHTRADVPSKFAVFEVKACEFYVDE